MTKRTKADMLPPGIHVAPYLDSEGRFMLVVLDIGSTFVGSTSVASVHGGWGDAHPFRADAVIEFDGPRHFMPTAAGAAPSVAEHLPMLPRGVHRAPWVHPGNRPEWVAISSRRRLVAASVLPVSALRTKDARRSEGRAIRDELARLLDALDSESPASASERE